MKHLLRNFCFAAAIIILFSGLIMWHAPNDEKNPHRIKKTANAVAVQDSTHTTK